MAAKRYNTDKPRLDLIPALWVNILVDKHGGPELTAHDLDDIFFADSAKDFEAKVLDVNMMAVILWNNEHYSHTSLIESVAAVMEAGAEKYDAWNWAKGMNYSVLMGCINRHYAKYLSGIDVDGESDQPHLTHVIVNLLFMLFYHQRYGDKFNDLPYTKINAGENDE